MRALASARSARGNAATGSVNWAFVITLFLLLGVVFMWWNAADERDQTIAKRDEYKKNYDAIRLEGQALADELDKTAKLMGFTGPKPLVWQGTPVTTVDRTAAEQHLIATGEVEFTSVEDPTVKVKMPGTLNILLNGLKVTITAAARSGDGSAVAKEWTKEVDFSWASQAFKGKLKDVNLLWQAIPPRPEPPADKDDEAATAKYRADLETYTRAVGNYNAAMSELTGPQFSGEWKQWKQVISGVPFDPDTTKAYELNFRPKLVGNEAKTFQDLLVLWKGPFEAILTEFRLNKETDQQIIAKLNSEKAALEKSLEEQKTRYTELQTGDAAELTRTKAELEKERTRADTNEQLRQQADNTTTQVSTDSKKQLAKANAENAAMKNRIASEKERADLEIRRDEVDGTLLSVSGRDTGTISVGSSDKAFPGLKFNVSYVDRGGARQTVGMVQVIKVTGPHSSEVRVLSATQPLVSGHLISNPLFASGREIHIYAVGWTPDLIQSRRLADMNVIVDAAPTARTDYFVVPDDWKGGTAAAPKEGEEPSAVPATNPLDKAKQEAFTFGATVITFRMLDAFLRL
jgi:hypothetical protein